MSQLSRTMIQLAQANQTMANNQQQHHQAWVSAQQQQADAFNALANATEQRKYDALFAAVPKFDGTNKEDCAVWLSRIESLVETTGRDLRIELLNRADGDVMTMLANIETVDDEALKEEVMRCFSNAPTTFQAIKVLRDMQQRPGEQARLYIARYEVIHKRANRISADDQNQNGEMMFFAGTLIPPLQKKLLKKMNSQYGPRSLREAFDMTLVFEREHQVTQPMCTFNVMETCYEEPQVQEEFATEEVQTRAQTQGQGYQQNYQGTVRSFRRNITISMVRSLIKGTTTRTTSTKASNLRISRDTSKITATNLMIRKDPKVKVKVRLYYLDWTVVSYYLQKMH